MQVIIDALWSVNFYLNDTDDFSINILREVYALANRYNCELYLGFAEGAELSEPDKKPLGRFHIQFHDWRAAGAKDRTHTEFVENAKRVESILVAEMNKIFGRVLETDTEEESYSVSPNGEF